MSSQQVDKPKSGGRYSDEKRKSVAVEYAVSGNLSNVERITGVSRATIRKWRDNGDDWWVSTVTKARHQIGEEILAAQLTNARLAGEQLQDRITNGDAKVVNSKDVNGKYHMTIKVPMTGKDLAVVNGIQVDKARTAMNMPTSISGKAESMEDLKKLFEQMAGDKVLVPKSTVIEHDNTNEND